MNTFSRCFQFSNLAKIQVICLILITAGCGAEHPQEYVEEGKVLLAKGDLESARVQFQNALQLDPKFADAYYQIALIDEQKQNWQGMLANLFEAVGNNPRHFEAQNKLGQIYLSAGQPDKAAEQVKLVLKMNPGDPTALLLDSSIQFRKGNFFEATQGVERVLAKKPYFADAVGLQANIMVAEKRLDDAIAVLEAGVEHNPDDRELRLLKIRIEVDGKQFDKAVDDYKAMIAKYPEDVGLRLALASLLNDMGQTAAAETGLQEAIKMFPAESSLKLNLVELIKQRDVDLAEKTLKDFIVESPKDTALKFRLVDYYIARQQFSDAEKILQEILAADEAESDQLAARIKLAQIALLQKDMIKVETLAEETLNIDPNQSDALLLRAGSRINKKDVDGAISDLRIVLRDRPGSEQAMILMALASMSKGEMEVAESQWRRVLEVNPNNRVAVLSLANELFKRDDFMRAEELLNKTAKANPNDPTPFELLIQLKAAKKDWQGAQQALDRLKQIPQAALAAKYWQGVIAALQGHTQEAIQFYQDVLAVQPDQRQALANLNQLYESTGHRADLIAYLKNLTAQNPGSKSALDTEASAYIADKNWLEAEKTLRKAIEKNPNDMRYKLKLIDVIEKQSESRAEINLQEYVRKHPDQVMFKFRLAGYYTDHKRYLEASSLLQEVANADPNGRSGLSAQLKLAELAWLQNNADNAKALLDKIINKDPRYNEALMLRASIRIAEKDVNAAIVDLNQVLGNLPDFGPALLMLAQAHQLQNAMDRAEAAWLRVLKHQPDNLAALQPLTAQLLKRGDWALAEQLLAKAVKASPSNPTILELLTQMYFAKKDWAGAQQAITALKKLPQSQLSASMLSANLAMNQGRKDEAIQIYKDILNKNPDFPDALLSIAQTYQKMQHQKELIDYLKTLLQRNPEAGAAHQVLAMAYATDKDWDDAEKVLQEKLKRNPKDTQSYALLALVYAKQGKDSEAEKTYLSGLAASGGNQQLMIDRAKYYLIKKDFDKAIEAYDEVVNKFPDNEESVNNLADLLVNHRADKQSIDRALTLVQPFKDSPNASIQDTFGWVHLKAGAVEPALTALKKAVSGAPKDPALRYHLASALFAHGEKQGAIIELERSLALAKEHGEFDDIDSARSLLSQLQKK